ncbi:MAG: hypothetical protein AAFV53_09240 [Myxococcota bacterium]
MIYGILIIAALVGLIAVPTAQRLFDIRGLTPLAWVVLLFSVVLPGYTAYTLLVPGDPIETASVAAMKDEVSLTLPPGHSLMVTAELGDDEEKTKTSYAMRVKGDGWAEVVTGNVNRSGGGNDDVIEIDGQKISEGGRRRAGKLSEDLQERFDLGSGPVDIIVTNYQGEAAKSLILEVVKGPPPLWLLWLLSGVVALLGLYLEVWKGLDKYAGDVAAIAIYAALMPQAGITPLDNIQGLAFSGLGAVLLGQGAVAAIAWISVKYVRSKEAAEEEAGTPPPAHTRR